MRAAFTQPYFTSQPYKMAVILNHKDPVLFCLFINLFVCFATVEVLLVGYVELQFVCSQLL